MLERVFCNASETARALIPDIVIAVNYDARPVNVRINERIMRITITRNATPTSRIIVGLVPAAFAARLIMKFIVSSIKMTTEIPAAILVTSTRIETITIDSHYS